MITYKAEGTGSVEATIAAVARATGVSAEEIRGRSRTRRIARARALVCWIAWMYERCPLTEIGAALGRHHTTVMAARESAACDRNNKRELRDALTLLAAPVRGAEA